MHHILLVDDDINVLSSSAELLNATVRDIEIHRATSVREALKIVEDYPIEAIITDRQMGRSDAGDILTKDLRSLGYTMPIAMLSGDLPSAALAQEIGLNAIFSKRGDPMDYVGFIKRSLNIA